MKTLRKCFAFRQLMIFEKFSCDENYEKKSLEESLLKIHRNQNRKPCFFVNPR